MSSLRIWRQAAVGLALGVGTLAAAAHAEPYVPADDNLVLERLPGAGDPILRRLEQDRAALAAAPSDLDAALRLARGYLEIGRREADPRYDGYAEAVLAPWSGLEPPPPAVLLLRATLKQRRHAFGPALDDLRLVLEQAPRHPQALLSSAVVLTVQGRAGEAARSCQRLAGLVDPLIEAACHGLAARVGPGGAEAYQALGSVLDQSARAPAAWRSWAFAIMGELALQQGMPAEAERHFQAGLTLAPDDSYLRAALSDLLLDQARPGEVVALLQDETRASALLLRRAIAAKRLGRPEAAALIASLYAWFDAERRRGDAVHRRERARFLLEVEAAPADALDVARANWAVQREPADALLLMQAALAAGEHAAARPVLTWIDEAELVDLRLEALARRLEGAA